MPAKFITGIMKLYFLKQAYLIIAQLLQTTGKNIYQTKLAATTYHLSNPYTPISFKSLFLSDV
jgi:hypothetical protein